MKEEKKSKKNKKVADDEIEVIIGGDSKLEFTEAKDCVNSLRPKDKKNITNKVIIPQSKGKK